VPILWGLKIQTRIGQKPPPTTEVVKMAPEPNELGPIDPDNLPYPDYREVLSALPNAELLNALDLTLLELEKRLYRYAHLGPELLEMANEGLVLAVRSRARLGQALSSAQHAEGHLQLVGVGEWKPTSTRPAWNTDPRVSKGEEE
jgi:hypothetical protein